MFARFPESFRFQLTEPEYNSLMSQFVTLSSETSEGQILKYQNGTSRWGGKRKPSYAFTEQGVAMLSAVLTGGVTNCDPFRFDFKSLNLKFLDSN